MEWLDAAPAVPRANCLPQVTAGRRVSRDERLNCSCIGRVCSKQAADGKRTEGAARSGGPGSNCLPARCAFLELPARNAAERAAEGRTARADDSGGVPGLRFSHALHSTAAGQKRLTAAKLL